MDLLYSMAPPSGGGGGGGIISLLPIVLIFVIFYFLLILPQRQQRKKHDEMIKNLKKGSTAVTSGGIHGTIIKIDKDTVTLQISQKAELTVDKSALSRIIS